MKPFAGAVGPGQGQGQGQQAHHFGPASRVFAVGILEVEAPRFQATEQGFQPAQTGGSRFYIKFFLKINRGFFDSLSEPVVLRGCLGTYAAMDAFRNQSTRASRRPNRSARGGSPN